MKIRGSLLCLILLSVIAYSNTFNGEFQFDDDISVIGNPYVNDISRFLGLNPVEGISGRPVTTFTFALNHRFGGLDVRWYHITNFLIHIFNGILIFYLVLLTMNSSKLTALDQNHVLSIALISAAVFLLHPIQTQAVSYISQRYESLASLFYLCSLIAYIKARHVSSWLVAHSNNELRTTNYELRTLHATRYTLYAVSIISGILAIGSKEIAITLPVIILLYDFYFLEDRPFFKRVAGPGAFIVLALIAGIIILIRISKGIDAGFSVKAFTPWEYFMTQFRVLTTYMRLLFLPINQNLDYDFRISKSLFEPDTLLSFVFLITLVAVAIMSFRKWRLGSFFILWFFIILAPTSSIIPVIDPIYEHRVYLASAGIFIAGIDGFFRFGPYRFIREKFPKGKVIIFASLIILLLLTLSITTFHRNMVWQTKLSLWEDVAKKSPMKSRARNNLGNCYFLLGKYFLAIEEYKKAIAIDKDNIGVYFNLAISLDRAGLENYALYYYEYFYRVAPPEASVQKEEVKKRIESLREMIDAAGKR